MLELWKILVLAVVQGVTEFLPVSSSGHVVVLGHLLGVTEVADLNIVLHVGTLGSILVYYRTRVWRLLGADRTLIPWLILATIPAVALGLPLKKWGGDWLESPMIAGAMLIVTGVLLLASRRLSCGDRDASTLRWWEAAAIGCSQAAAVLPGLSRSGATIVSGMALGLHPRAATTFSFLMAIPIIAGGGLYEALKASGDSASTPRVHLAAGAAVAFVVGLLSLRVLTAVIERGRLARFAWWCIPLGIAVVVWRLAG